MILAISLIHERCFVLISARGFSFQLIASFVLRDIVRLEADDEYTSPGAGGDYGDFRRDVVWRALSSEGHGPEDVALEDGHQ